MGNRERAKGDGKDKNMQEKETFKGQNEFCPTKR